MENNLWIVSIDIERSGPDLSDRIMSVGIVLGTDDGNILLYSRIPIKYTFDDIKSGLWNGRLYETSCKKEFWDKLDKNIRLCSIKGGINTTKAANKISNILNFIHENADKYGYKLVFVSDNIDGDYSPLNYFLKKTINRVPVRWNSLKKEPKYRSIKDSWDSLGIFLGNDNKKVNLLIEKFIVHNHDPLMDAFKTYTEFVITNKTAEWIKNDNTKTTSLLDIRCLIEKYIMSYGLKISKQININIHGCYVFINKEYCFTTVNLLK